MLSIYQATPVSEVENMINKQLPMTLNDSLCTRDATRDC